MTQPRVFRCTMIFALARRWGYLDLYQDPAKDQNEDTVELERARSKPTCSAAARVLNVTTTSPFSCISIESIWPVVFMWKLAMDIETRDQPTSYQSLTACTFSVLTPCNRNFLGRLSRVILNLGGAAPRDTPRKKPRLPLARPR